MKAAIMGLAALLAGAGALDYAARPAASDAILKAELIDAQARGVAYKIGRGIIA